MDVSRVVHESQGSRTAADQPTHCLQAWCSDPFGYLCTIHRTFIPWMIHDQWSLSWSWGNNTRTFHVRNNTSLSPSERNGTFFGPTLFPLRHDPWMVNGETTWSRLVTDTTNNCCNFSHFTFIWSADWYIHHIYIYIYMYTFIIYQ